VTCVHSEMSNRIIVRLRQGDTIWSRRHRVKALLVRAFRFRFGMSQWRSDGGSIVHGDRPWVWRSQRIDAARSMPVLSIAFSTKELMRSTFSARELGGPLPRSAKPIQNWRRLRVLTQCRRANSRTETVSAPIPAKANLRPPTRCTSRSIGGGLRATCDQSGGWIPTSERPQIKKPCAGNVRASMPAWLRGLIQ
jgi:hypothetical protein